MYYLNKVYSTLVYNVHTEIYKYPQFIHFTFPETGTKHSTLSIFFGYERGTNNCFKMAAEGSNSLARLAFFLFLFSFCVYFATGNYAKVSSKVLYEIVLVFMEKILNCSGNAVKIMFINSE